MAGRVDHWLRQELPSEEYQMQNCKNWRTSHCYASQQLVFAGAAAELPDNPAVSCWLLLAVVQLQPAVVQLLLAAVVAVQ